MIFITRIEMEIDPVNSPTSSSSSYDFLPELMGPLKQTFFECFALNCQAFEFMVRFNETLKDQALSFTPRGDHIIQASLEMGCAKNECHPLLFSYLDALYDCKVSCERFSLISFVKYFDQKSYVIGLSAYRNFNKPKCFLSIIEKIADLLQKTE
jgi:hypothetical protein